MHSTPIGSLATAQAPRPTSTVSSREPGLRWRLLPIKGKLLAAHRYLELHRIC